MSLAEARTANRPAAGGDTAAKAWLRALEATAPIASHPTHTLASAIDGLANLHGDAPALLSDRESFSYRALARRTNQYARWALEQGVHTNDTVGLLMPNRPEYMAIWLGITRIGGVVALLNTNLTGASLAHCVNIVGAKHVIAAAELMDGLAAALPHLKSPPKVWMHGAGDRDLPRIDRDIERFSGSALASAGFAAPIISDRALCIYTSGTTGLPKAANVSHDRVMRWSHWFAGMMDTRPDDRMYDCLPMYHSVGGVVATGALLVNGGSVVLREKFSASEFWSDIARWDCTLLQYIGELCRYLVNADRHPRELGHRIRLACGNGLRPDVWDHFKQRFQIPKVLEFYAATEGSFSLYNAEGRPGAIGRIPPFLAHRFPVALVKFDVEAGEPVRGEDGLCIRCLPDETGEALGKIVEAQPGTVGGFEGYTSKRESQKKILRNVFKPGDAWYRTGDLMRKDDQGYFHFVDRAGDTFRWKGENVATSEVSEVLTECEGVLEANVYGVAIPGTDGRAGMAALVTNGDFELSALRKHIVERLPAYAQPVFLRIGGTMDVTATFKHRKAELVREGFDPGLTSDTIFFNDAKTQAFVRLNRTLFERIQSGQVRL